MTEDENRLPYFNGQKSADCGCYYPDVSRIPSTGAIWCRRHGFLSGNAPLHALPTAKWMEGERERLRESFKAVGD